MIPRSLRFLKAALLLSLLMPPVALACTWFLGDGALGPAGR